MLLEANIGGETSKYGFKQWELREALETSRELTNVVVLGLMTMAPYGANRNELHRIFGGLRKLRDELGLKELSMGMSDDFEVAVEEGATILRIGRTLFG